MRFRDPALGLMCLAYLASCNGVVGADASSNSVGPNPSNPGSTPTNLSLPDPTSCTGNSPLLSPQLRRLTPTQYRNTLEVAFGQTFNGSELPNFQDDNPTIGLANDPAKLRITNITVDSVYASARTVSARVAEETPAVSGCIAETGTACFESVIDTIGTTLWRRPVSAEERAELMSGIAAVGQQSGTRAEQMSFLVQALLMSSNTLYRTEVGEGAGGMAQLTSYELASLLSYTLWDGPPDSELMDLAASDALRGSDVLAAQAERMMADPRFVSTVSRFYWDYLKLENIYTVPKDGSFGLNGNARYALADSAQATLNTKLSAPDADFLSVFRGQEFQVNARSAPFFGAESGGLGDAPEPQTFSASEREGILTHPAFLAVHAGQGSTGIVKRGVFTLEQLLGFTIPDPPDDISSVDPDDLPPDFNPDLLTTRELLQLTHSSQARCRACHITIDPAGFGYENFDPVGNFRLTEKQGLTIDASGDLNLGNETLQFTDSISYVQTMATSDSLRNSVLAHYFAYAMGQIGDGCEALRFSEAVETTGDRVRALAEQIVQTPSFSTRQ